MSLDESIWMYRALAEAERGRGVVEPNPMVGAVVVRDGKVVGEGHHAVFGGPHAEIVALRCAGDASIGATLYVTLEPCCHVGKTPPCTDAVLRAGVTRVVAAMRDPFPQVAGGGIAVLRDAGVRVDVGLLQAEAERLNAPYLKRLTTGRPYVIGKWAMTLDGKIAARTGRSVWISSPRSRALAHQVRGRMDAIIVGIGTAIADDPQLTVRPPGPRAPTRVVLDSTARLPIDGNLAQSARSTPVIVAATTSAPLDRVERLRALGCEVLILPEFPLGRVSIAGLLDVLGGRGMTNVLVEGGGRALGAFFDANEVDEVDIFIAPLIESGSHAFTPVRGVGFDTIAEGFRLEASTYTQVGKDLRIVGRVVRGTSQEDCKVAS